MSITAEAAAQSSIVDDFATAPLLCTGHLENCKEQTFDPVTTTEKRLSNEKGKSGCNEKYAIRIKYAACLE